MGSLQRPSRFHAQHENHQLGRPHSNLRLSELYSRDGKSFGLPALEVVTWQRHWTVPVITGVKYGQGYTLPILQIAIQNAAAADNTHLAAPMSWRQKRLARQLVIAHDNGQRKRLTYALPMSFTQIDGGAARRGTILSGGKAL